MAPKILWIGLGNMGRGMCKNLVEKGNLDSPLILYNRTKKRSEDLASKLPSGKTEITESIQDGVAKADIIFTCVANDAAVQETYEAALKGDVKGKLFVECSTIHPEVTEQVAKKALSQGADFVASPVFGPPAAADGGQLIFVLAGPKAAIEKVKPYTKGVMGKADVDMVDAPYGKATTLKVVGNTFILNMITQLSEAYTLAEKSGLETDYVKQVIDGVFGGPYSAYSGRLLTGDYHKREEPQFAVDLARKDAGHALALAQKAGVPIKGTENADGYLKIVKEHAGEKGDIAGIYGAVRKQSGLKFEN